MNATRRLAAILAADVWATADAPSTPYGSDLVYTHRLLSDLGQPDQPTAMAANTTTAPSHSSKRD
jgi:hypothetical protein